MQEELINIAKQIDIEGQIIDVKIKNEGNINKTYIVTYKMIDGEEKKFIFQKINTTVFKEPYKLMKNIESITRWIKKKTIFSGDLKHPCLEVIHTKNNKALAVIPDENDEKQYYRVYNWIENSISYDRSTDEKIVYSVGQAFGHFQKMLIDYPIRELEETIPDFHNTPKRYKNFLKDITLDVYDRVNSAANEIVSALKYSDCCYSIVDLINKGKIPIRVVHNDTKVNNVMMKQNSNEYLTVIDLDTVMPGSSLYDYGDGVRSIASNALEDEKDLNQVYLNLSLFEAFTSGYLSEMAEFLTEDEVCNMGEAIKVITYELGLRFLNDYINGDTYFKTEYDTHNLDRVRNQFKLLEDIQNKLDYINEYILKEYKRLTKNKTIIKK